jgi:hypothetical protein
MCVFIDKEQCVMRRKHYVRGNPLAAGAGLTLLFLLVPPTSTAQSPPGGAPPSSSSSSSVAVEPSLNDVVRELQGEVRELRQSVEELRAEAARYRTETQALHDELQRDRAPVQAAAFTPADHPTGGNPAQAGVLAAQPAAAPSPDQSEVSKLAKVEEDARLLNDKVDQQNQTKVESGSKYHLRLYGLALFNLFDNRGAVDSIDNPSMAAPGTPGSAGSFGGTLRQSIVGLQAFGPQVAGAKTTADVQFDFAGGFPQAENGDTYGIARLRTAVLRMDWENTSVVAGQDSLFFAPLSPTSFASVSQPALAYAGNLWAWTPQLRIERRVAFSDGSAVTMQAGILDPLTGDYPADPYYRQPTAGELADEPAYAAHISYSHDLFGRPLNIGVGGYFDRQDWGLPHRVNGWAGVTDLSIPVSRLFTVSGEFYRGSAVGGLGGGVGQTVLFTGPPGTPTSVTGLNSLGGWAQLKFKPLPKLEFNGAFGQDNPYANQFNSAEVVSGYYLEERNRGSLANVIYRPRSDLVLALEYRHLRTYEFPPDTQSANQFNLSMGVLF